MNNWTDDDIDRLANAIAEQNKGKGSYVIRFTEGDHRGQYLGRNWGKSVKTTAYAMSTICNNKADWHKHIEYTPFKNTAYDIVCKKQPESALHAIR